MSDSKRSLRGWWLLPLLGLAAAGGWFRVQTSAAYADRAEVPVNEVVGHQLDGSYLVPTGQVLRPIGKQLAFDGRPVDMSLSPDGKTLALLLPTGIRMVNMTDGKFIGPLNKGYHNFAGIAWSHDGTLVYSSASPRGADGKYEGAVEVDHVQPDGSLQPLKPIMIPLKVGIQPDIRAKQSGTCGMVISPDGKMLYVSLFENATIACINLSTYNAATGSASFTQVPVGSSPDALTISPDGSTLYAADRGGRRPEPGDTEDLGDPVVVSPASYKADTGEVTVIDAAKAVTQPERAVVAQIAVGLQPTALAVSPNGSRLYVACSNSDELDIIDSATFQIIDKVNSSPAPGILGDSSPNGLAVTGNGGTLFVSLGGDNAIAEYTLSRKDGGSAAVTSRRGLIPTAWFPVDICLANGGQTLCVANSKGYGSLGSLYHFHPDPFGAASPAQGPGGIEAPAGGFVGHTVYNVIGTLGLVPVPDARNLHADTRLTEANDHFDRMAAAIYTRPAPFWSRFKHVIMIIKENRTYDQVFGDMHTPGGTPGGDKNLVMFGQTVTPNHHALASRFGLFDNLYCSGEISADGHHWVDEAFADDYDERMLDRYPRSYPCCGTDPLSFAGTQFLWQAAMDRGISFRDYGEYGPLPSIARHADAMYNMPAAITASQNEDVNHEHQFEADVIKHGLSRLTYLWFPNDHTSGLRPGAYSPESDVADNDLALGRLVSFISHSRKYWHDEPTCIFVVEDDAQGGLDHIDGHRTVGLVISPFNVEHKVNSSFYDQLTMDRTMELMLGMPPQNQFDAAATPMRDAFTNHGDFRPYDFVTNRIALNLRNPEAAALTGEAKHWAEVASRLNFSAPDLADPAKVTAMLWFHTHGAAPFPPPDAAQ